MSIVVVLPGADLRLTPIIASTVTITVVMP